VLFWHELERQVRVEAQILRVSVQESNHCFQSQSAGSRIGAWASPQSDVIKNRESLEIRCQELEKSFEDGTIPRPPNWGGFRLVPETIEFWQGRPSWLPDRLPYIRREQSKWLVERLAP
jgi:pyridoxamine 5'-phosphate oxidase